MSYVHITKHGGKMEGIPSINVSVNLPFCKKMNSIPGSICEGCYAHMMFSMYNNLEGALLKNKFLYTREIDEWEIPRFPSKSLVRFDSFGELQNIIHLKNYYAIAKTNPEVLFALWTKRKNIVWSLKEKCPDNLTLIYSFLMMNPDMEKIKIPQGFDLGYAVFNDNSAKPCGERCIKCRICYTHKGKKPIIIRQRKH